LHIFFLSLAIQKFFPRFQQVFNADYIFKTMNQLNFHKKESFITPPSDGVFTGYPKINRALQIVARFPAAFSQNLQICAGSED
jgi:hypothetical protein